MSVHVIKIPDVGEGIAEVELVEWLVKVGDFVHEDQNVASVMTDKVSVDISSPVAGTVERIGGNAGDILLVGADLISIQVDGPDTPEDTGFGSVTNESPAKLFAEVSQPEVDSLGVEALAVGGVQSEAETEEESTLKNPDISAVRTGAQTDKSVHHELLKGVLASPAVRKRIADLGYKLSDIAHALGIERVAHGDVDRYLLEQQQGSAYDPKASARPGDTKNGSNETGQKAEAGIPLRGLRRQIAQKMQRSAHEIPHVSYVESLDVTDLEALRTQLNQKWAKNRGHLTLLPFLVRAISLAIKEHPRLNATFDSSTQLLTECSDVNMGIATQTNEGLMVPVLHQAQRLSAWEIAAAIRTLSEAAKEGSLSRERATGSTITLSSLGSLGGIASTPIINHPEVAVIGVNKIVEQPVVREGQVVIRKMMNLSSSFDHRIIDGYDAAAFIQSVRRLIETPALMFIN